MIGQRVVRNDDDRLLRGRGAYVDDLPARGALEVVFVRSTQAHARIISLDLDAARTTPGVVAVYSAVDLGSADRPLPLLFPHPDLVEPRTQHPMATDEVNYVGQIVAMIVASNRSMAEDGRDQVGIEWEPLPVVIDLDSAVADGAARVHADMPSNVSGRIVQEVGHVDAAFKEASVVFSRRYVLERSAAMPLETRGMVAEYDTLRQTLTLWDTTQAVHPLRSALASFFAMPEDRVRVIAPDTGGGFGVKGFFPYPEEVLVPWAAMLLQRPIKWIEDRVEHFTASHHERSQIHTVEVAATDEGVVLGLRDRFLLDTGAYVPYGLELGRIAASQIGGAYRIPNIQIEVRGVYTNTITCTPYRGAGRPHTCFVTERVLDDVAKAVGITPWEVRRRNFIGNDEFPYRRDGLVTADGFTVIVDSGNYFEQLDTLERAVAEPLFRSRQEQSRQSRRWLGLGIACYVESTGGGPYEGVHISVEPNTGMVQISTGFTNQGQSHATTLAQVAAEQLGVDVSHVELVEGDTSAFRWGVATYASRGAVLGGNAVARAATKVRDKALRLASNMLEVAAADLEVANGRVFVRGSPQISLELRQIAKAAKPDRYGFDAELTKIPGLQRALRRELADEGPALPGDEEPGLEATAYFSAQNATWASGAHAAIVEVDLDTGGMRYLRYIAVHDCGKMINPLIVEGQVIGGIAQGIGGSFYERLAYDNEGQLRNASLMDFLMPYATEVPAIELHHLETMSPLNPLGIKGAGEAGAIPVPAVTAAAIEDALAPFDVRVLAMPLDPERVIELIGHRDIADKVLLSARGARDIAR